MSRTLRLMPLAALTAGVLITAVMPARAGANLVLNPNFDVTGYWSSPGYVTLNTIADWTESSDAGSSAYSTNGFWDNSYVPGDQGTNSYVGFLQGNNATISQTINGLTAGDTYALTFYVSNRVYTQNLYAVPDGLSAYVGGAQVYSGSVYAQSGYGSAANPFQKISESFTATAPSEVLEFESVQPANTDLAVLVANASIVDTGPAGTVPEPASVALFAGAAAMAGLIRRRRQAAV